MKKRIRVRARTLADPALKGKARFLAEGSYRDYIGEDPEGREVDDTPFYRRAIHLGDLELVKPRAPKQTRPKRKPTPLPARKPAPMIDDDSNATPLGDEKDQ